MPLDSCALGLALAAGVACLHAHCGCSICPRFVLAKLGCLGLGAGLFRCNRAACHGWPVPGHRGQQAASLFRCRPAGRGPVPAAWRFKHCSGAAVAGTWQFLLPTLCPMMGCARAPPGWARPRGHGLARAWFWALHRQKRSAIAKKPSSQASFGRPKQLGASGRP